MYLHQVALVSDTTALTYSELSQISAALQKQATRDLGPIWRVRATVDPFPSLEDVPVGYWPIIIEDDINKPGAAGVHKDNHGQPFALVQYEEDWSITASHECLEMLADPWGNRLIAAPSPKKGQGQVEFLVEVCDPCEDNTYAYDVDGVKVSDFITPHYYGTTARRGVHYSFTGALEGPKQVLPGGYTSWYDPKSGHWWQLAWFGNRPEYRDLGALNGTQESLRAEISRITTPPRVRPQSPASLQRPYSASSAKAAMWRAHIEALRAA